MIGQRFPTVDEPVRCITAIITPPGFGCKGLFSCVQVSVLPSDTSASRRFAMGCNRRGFRSDGLEFWSVTSPFQPPLVWAAHY
jgi:hypothetical protein